MERFPRGTLPPSRFAAVATIAPNAVTRPPEVVAEPPRRPSCDLSMTSAPPSAELRVGRSADLSTICPSCNTQMQPEHAHYKCPACGYRDSCCF